MASKIKSDQWETLDGSGNVTINNSVTMAANQTLPAVSLTGALPAISGASLTALNATNLGSGTVPTARLGSGTASNSVFLRGDGSWQTAGSTSASDLTSGTLPMARLSGTLPALNGSALTNLSAGKILQVVTMQTSTSTGVSDATWTATAVTLAITPSATSSKILLMWSGQMYSQNTAGDGGYAHNFQQAISGGATTSPVELHSNSGVNYSSHYTQRTTGQFSHYVTTHGIVSPNTTSAITYTLYIINYNANGVGVNSQGGKSALTLMEIAG